MKVHENVTAGASKVLSVAITALTPTYVDLRVKKQETTGFSVFTHTNTRGQAT
jgi:hypothetical protein